MKTILAVGAVAALSSAALAQPYYARGDFNGWAGTANELTLVSGDHYSTVVSGLTPGTRYEFKGTNDDWSFNGPFDNVQAFASAGGELEIHFWTGPAVDGHHGDGWLPEDQPRTGFTDLNGTGWEIMGDWDGWTSPQATFADVGGGVWEATWFSTAGVHEFKARRTGDWNVAIGVNFGGAGGNLSYDAGAAGSNITMRIDTAGGRYQLVPAPASLALLGLGGLATRRRR